MNFSQRMGLEPAKKLLQLESMDDELKQEMYNVIINYENHMRCNPRMLMTSYFPNETAKK